MASRPSETSERIRSVSEYQINEEQEADLMIRYTKVFTRELVFAVDMMTYIMQDNNLLFVNFIYPNCLGRPCPSDFDDVMKKFVDIMLKKYKYQALNLIEKNINLDQPNYVQFKRFVNASAIRVESLRYQGYGYVVFCIMMAQMCSVAYLHGITRAPEFGIMLMCRTHSTFIMKSVLPPNPWEDIKTIACKVVNMMENQ